MTRSNSSPLALCSVIRLTLLSGFPARIYRFCRRTTSQSTSRPTPSPSANSSNCRKSSASSKPSTSAAHAGPPSSTQACSTHTRNPSRSHFALASARTGSVCRNRRLASSLMTCCSSALCRHDQTELCGAASPQRVTDNKSANCSPHHGARNNATQASRSASLARARQRVNMSAITGELARLSKSGAL